MYERRMIHIPGCDKHPFRYLRLQTDIGRNLGDISVLVQSTCNRCLYQVRLVVSPDVEAPANFWGNTAIRIRDKTCKSECRAFQAVMYINSECVLKLQLKREAVDVVHIGTFHDENKT